MAITLDEARGIVRRISSMGTISPPSTGSAGMKPRGGDDGLPPGPGKPTGGGTGDIQGPTFEEDSGAKANERVYLGDDGLWRYGNGTVAPQWVQEYLNGQGPDGPGGSDNEVGLGNLAQRRAEFGRSIFEDDRNYGRSVFESDRNFGQAQLQDNRTELGNRAGTALSFGDFLLDMALRDDALANDPGNFPAWLQAMQGNTGAGPVVQNLVGEGVSIQPQENSYINDPRFRGVIDSLFNYSKIPDAGDVDRTQQAYNRDPVAAQQFFSQDPDALKRMFGTPMATGGVVDINRPMRLQDLTTGENVATMGEAGDETMAVVPNAGVSNTPRLGSAGTFGALAKAIAASGYGSAFPRDILDRMASGFAPNPGDVPDWLLSRLPPSLRGLLAAGVKAQLGSTGLEDYDFTRSLYEQKGFTGAGGISR